MPTPTIEETAYTVVGLNVLVADKAIDVIVDVRTQVTDMLGPVGENVSDVIARAETVLRQAGEEIDGRIDVSSELDKARKVARKQVSAWRRSVDPVAERVESSLPDDVADFLSTQRAEAWKIVGAKMPAAKSTAKTAAKPAAKSASKTATKSSASKKTAAKSTASKKTAAKSTAK
ncbi:MAG: hypothetical protein IH940_06630 [Acidobacteria bacterium]|nr:hypothetical protein [Acidobacteriota bacterium]